MSLVSVFEIGVWNAWILLLFLPLHPLIMMLIDELVDTGDTFRKKGGSTAYDKSEKIANILGRYILRSGSIDRRGEIQALHCPLTDKLAAQVDS
jgi:hypothetical protein